MAIFAILLACLADPIRWVLSIVTSRSATRKRHLFGCSLIVTIVSEVLLMSTQVTRTLGAAIFIGFAASLMQVSLSYFIFKKIRARKALKELGKTLEADSVEGKQ